MAQKFFFLVRHVWSNVGKASAISYITSSWHISLCIRESRFVPC